jgi:hypothetical protein
MLDDTLEITNDRSVVQVHIRPAMALDELERSLLVEICLCAGLLKDREHDG